jgi:rsbT co-antagonist protein RsbR
VEFVNHLERFSNFLTENAEAISREIVDYNLNKIEIKLPKEIIEKSIKTNRDFLLFLGHTLNTRNEQVAGEFITWHKENANQEEVNQFSFADIEKIIKPYAESRLRLIEMITKNSIAEGLTTEEVVYVNNRISFLLDLSITETMIERERLANELNTKNLKVITELSSPVVPLENGLAILPLIGEFDLDRSHHIMNNVIPKVSELKLDCLIIDLSGIATIDTEVAREVFKINDILGLLGIHSMYTGIRPDLAVKVISAGIDLTSLNTFGTVQQAILNRG